LARGGELLVVDEDAEADAREDGDGEDTVDEGTEHLQLELSAGRAKFL
jgi:hypothetical protein